MPWEHHVSFALEDISEGEKVVMAMNNGKRMPGIGFWPKPTGFELLQLAAKAPFDRQLREEVAAEKGGDRFRQRERA